MSQSYSTSTLDIIIIGRGTAGSLLAARLSSNSSLRVLVLEGGRNRNDDANVRTPGLSRKLLGNPSYDWQFQTSPEAGLNGRVIQQPRGKLWGGSSAINSHALVYPSRWYHDAWDTLLGNGDRDPKVRWDWNRVKGYYRRFQTVQKPSDEIRRTLKIGKEVGGDGDDASSGEGRGKEMEEVLGGVQASFPVTAHVLQKAWADTSKI
jgi:choline dehydrogenase-like flavoprotein